MFLPTMDAVDIMRLKEKEKLDCRAKITHAYEKGKKLARNAVRAHGRMTYSSYWKHPKSQSEYILCFAIEDKKSLDRPPFFYLPIIRDKGINLVMTSVYLQEAVVFTPHFFDRYAERMKIDEPDRIELISSFVCKNWRFGERSVDKERHGRTEYEIKLPEGAAMCNWNAERSILYAKTFITDEMYYGKQRERLENIKLHNIKSFEAQDMRLKVLAEKGVL